MNGLERVIAALRHEEPDRVPLGEAEIDAPTEVELHGSAAFGDVNGLDTIGVGATFSVATGKVFTTTGALAVNGALGFGITPGDDDSGVTMTTGIDVGGTVTFGPGTMIKVFTVDGTEIPKGTNHIVSSTGISGFSNLSVDASAATENLTYKLRQVDNDIFLRVSAAGLVVFIQ
jgi:hypothetical protein